MADQAVMDIVSVPQAIAWQAEHAEKNGAPGTARIVRALLALEDSQAATARRINGWQGLSLRDAMPLRIAGGIHNLLLTGEEPRLEDVYAGRMSDQGQVDTLVRELVETYDARLMPWLDGPPQTNEAGRSASLMAGLLWLTDGRVAPQFELLEIGASAGINTMMGRYRYDLGGVRVGPSASRMVIEPDWRGSPPPESEPAFVDARGSDIAPVDLSDEAQALRLKSYVWPEAFQRMARIDTAIALAERMSPEIERMDAGDWVEQELTKPQDEGVTRVLTHSIMWQYLPDFTQERITAAMEQAGAAADADRPLAWLSLETNRETFAHELHVRYWPGGEEAIHLANAHAHGEWVEWLG
ncbi:DUF2332 domain-containing protein [Qipengyuania sp. XHP0211]|uniref:DUF2332 domain-containing protein n=1 Tax=Qipengyuania sp. XHP0211 TaxID=3038079 RepID=UPI00242040E0|nr:DUF2332 domain-containing protein [Qipengyuania sp. XHP0211]MDG5749799.1 DUF2332 domain-containing protein [Qipengyuania sp. XHP0211]